MFRPPLLCVSYGCARLISKICASQAKCLRSMHEWIEWNGCNLRAISGRDLADGERGGRREFWQFFPLSSGASLDPSQARVFCAHIARLSWVREQPSDFHLIMYKFSIVLPCRKHKSHRVVCSPGESTTFKHCINSVILCRITANGSSAARVAGICIIFIPNA